VVNVLIQIDKKVLNKMSKTVLSGDVKMFQNNVLLITGG
jgi:hypothetical protein